jgi:signal transduction histidine kinase
VRGTAHGTRIHLADRTTRYTVSGHHDLLQQVFINIFENAIKYGTGDVTVTPRIQKSTGQLFVEVAGPSVPLDSGECARVFELGFRGKAAREKTASGTGLGLYICRKILEDVHSATIEAEHSPSTHVTTFRIRFPNYKIKEPHEVAH